MPKKWALNLIGLTVLLLFVGVWTAILIQAVGAAQAGEVADIQEGLTVAGGTVSTLIASLTAAALGFSIAEAKSAKVGEFLDEARTHGKAYGSLPQPGGAVRGLRSVAQMAPSELTSDQREGVDAAREVSKLRPSDLDNQLTALTIVAILTYLGVGTAVLVVWLSLDSLSPAIVSGFALSVVGWLIGSAGVVFEIREKEQEPSPTAGGGGAK